MLLLVKLLLDVALVHDVMPLLLLLLRLMPQRYLPRVL